MAENNLSGLIGSIGTDVYGREMREHIVQAFEILAQSSLTAEEKAKIAAAISYTPQTLNDDQKRIARNNIGAAKAGDSGRGWTEEQITLFEQFKTQLATVFAKIGYKDNSASGEGQIAAGAAITKLTELIESLRSVPRELESITLAVNAMSHISGEDITKNELVVTCHYSVGPDEVITDGYTIDPVKWTHPYTNVKVTYNGVESNPVLVPVAEPPAATISIDNASDTTNLKVTVNLGTEQIAVSKGNPYLLYEADMSKNVTITIQVEAAQTGKYVIDDGTEVTMVNGTFSKTGTIYMATSITGNIVIKAVSRALPQRINAVYDGTVVPYNTGLNALKDHLTVTGMYYGGQAVDFGNDQYDLSITGGALVPGNNTVTVTGQGEFSGKTDMFDVTMEQESQPTTKATGTATQATSSTVIPVATTNQPVTLAAESGDGFTSEPNKITLSFSSGYAPTGYKINTVTLQRSGTNWTVTAIKNGTGNENLNTGGSATVVWEPNSKYLKLTRIENVMATLKTGGEAEARSFSGSNSEPGQYAVTVELI